jgi:hypothetical protein
MRIIHCTKKLLKELDVPLIELENISVCTEGLGNWYANLLRIDRRKCLMFTNEKSLYTFLIPKVLKAKLKNIEKEFLINLSYNLQAEGFSIEVINRVMQEYHEIGFAKTASKKVLGSMNQLAFEYEVLIEQKEGLENIRILELNKHINRTIIGTLNYKYPIEVLKNLLKSYYI